LRAAIVSRIGHMAIKKDEVTKSVSSDLLNERKKVSIVDTAQLNFL